MRKFKKMSNNKMKIGTGHYIAMAIVFFGGIVLFAIAIGWIILGNLLMALGMLTMGLIAEANFALHWQTVHKK